MSANAIAELQQLLDREHAKVLRLEEKVRMQRHELEWHNKALRERNLQLDAMHWVWCDGPCKGGIHRWTEAKLTEELVAEAERNTRRLRTKLNSMKAKGRL